MSYIIIYTEYGDSDCTINGLVHTQQVTFYLFFFRKSVLQKVEAQIEKECIITNESTMGEKKKESHFILIND